MKITELDFTKEGKRYRYGKIIFEIKDGDLINIESNAYLRDANISIADLLKMEFEEIKKMKNPYTRVDDGADYHYISELIVYSYKEDNDETDNKLFSKVNYFNNKEYAEYIAFKETLMRKLDRFAWEHNAKVIDWNNCFTKYYIIFDHEDNELRIDVYYTVQSNDIYFTSREIAEKAIEEFKEDLVKLYTWKFDFS